MIFKPNFLEKANGIKPGTYHVVISSYNLRTSKRSNTPFISWESKVIGTEFAGEKIFITTMLEGRGTLFLKKFLRAINPSYDGGAFEASNYLNKEALVEVQENNLPDGTISSYPKVKNILPLTENKGGAECNRKS